MTFKKNLFVLLSSVFLAVIGALLVGIEFDVLISGLTLVIPTVVMALLIEDLWRKLLGAREKLTWQYFIGEAFIIGSVLTFFWASKSDSVKSCLLRLLSVFLFGVLGGIWTKFIYRPSTQTYEERAQESWAKFRRKAKKSTKEEGTKLLNNSLRFRLVGDNLDGDLDFERPLGIFNEQCMTYEELCGSDDDGTGNLGTVQRAAYEYIQALVSSLES